LAGSASDLAILRAINRDGDSLSDSSIGADNIARVLNGICWAGRGQGGEAGNGSEGGELHDVYALKEELEVKF